jgi:hypothetical protein
MDNKTNVKGGHDTPKPVRPESGAPAPQSRPAEQLNPWHRAYGKPERRDGSGNISSPAPYPGMNPDGPPVVPTTERLGPDGRKMKPGRIGP